MAQEGYSYSRTDGKWQKKTEAEANYEGMTNEAGEILLAYWRLYPDRFLELCEAEKPDYKLAPIQCIIIRAECRYEEVDVTGGRGITKSYTGLLSRMVLGVLYPGVRGQYFGPTSKQTVSIVRDAWRAVSKNYPLLAELWNVRHDTNERFVIQTQHGSTIDIDVMRGTNANSVFAEEVAQEESGERFEHEKFRSAVLPAIRLQRLVNGVMDTMYPNFQKCYVTSAGRQQNESFEYRRDILKNMAMGKRAFALDIPGDVAVLNGIRSIQWYDDMRRKLTPEEWLREMCAKWTGACENPVIRDSTLTESRNLLAMENRHCGDPKAIYILSYDVSYADGARNAKCATCVLKLEEQFEPNKHGRYLKSIVYVVDEDPPQDGLMQAKKLKQRWAQFCLDGGQTTYLAIDARAYGQAVLEDLHKDLGDGLPPLCCVNHSLQNIEQPGALPVIYPIRATNGYANPEYVDAHDNDADMLRYAEVEWEQRNVRMLTANINEGVVAYKRMHRIKDDLNDPIIAIPYYKSRELAGQIANLKKKATGTNLKEERISRAINRDMWSATKYALRIAQRLEYQNLVNANKRPNEWTQLAEGKQESNQNRNEPKTRLTYGQIARFAPTPRIVERAGGNNRWR